MARKVYEEDGISQSGFRYIEKLLYDRKKYDTAIAEYEEELEKVLERLSELSFRQYTLDGMPHETGTSSPTENFAIIRVDNLQVKYLKNRIEEMKRQKKAIEKAMLYMTDTEKLFIKLKYDREKAPRECMKEMHIEKSRWYEMRHEIIKKTSGYLGVY